MKTHGVAAGELAGGVEGGEGAVFFFFGGEDSLIVSIGSTTSTVGGRSSLACLMFSRPLRNLMMSAGLAISAGVLHCCGASEDSGEQRNWNFDGSSGFIL